MRTGFHQKRKFRIIIDGFSVADFKTCSELSMEVGVVENREGGSPISDKAPGNLTSTPITLERGVVTTFEMHTWFKEVVNAAAGIGQPSANLRRDVDIQQLDLDDSVLVTYRVFNSWPNKYMAGEWDNEAEEVVVESVTLVNDYFDRV